MPKTLKEACELSIKKWEDITKNLEKSYITDDDFFEVTKSCGLCSFYNRTSEIRCKTCVLFDPKQAKECYNLEPYKSIYQRVDRLNRLGCLNYNSAVEDEEQIERLRGDVISYGETLIEKLSLIVEESEESN